MYLNGRGGAVGAGGATETAGSGGGGGGVGCATYQEWTANSASDPLLLATRCCRSSSRCPAVACLECWVRARTCNSRCCAGRPNGLRRRGVPLIEHDIGEYRGSHCDEDLGAGRYDHVPHSPRTKIMNWTSACTAVSPIALRSTRSLSSPAAGTLASVPLMKLRICG